MQRFPIRLLYSHTSVSTIPDVHQCVAQQRDSSTIVKLRGPVSDTQGHSGPGHMRNDTYVMVVSYRVVSEPEEPSTLI